MSYLAIEREEFLRAVEFVKEVIPINPIMVADGNLIFNFDGNSELVIHGSDGTKGTRYFLEVENKGSGPFKAGVDSKRLAKLLKKDTSENITIEKSDTDLIIADENNRETNFSKLALGNIARASDILSWEPKNPINEIEAETALLIETLSFLDDFLPDGKDEGSKHAVIVFDKGFAHVTNGVNIRGICASRGFQFVEPVSIRKRYANSTLKSLKSTNCDRFTIKDDLKRISFISQDRKKWIVIPKHRKEPPALPVTYLKALGSESTTDFKALVKGLDKISSSNYNSMTTLTGVDLVVKGQGDNATLKLILEGNKATDIFKINRDSGPDLEKTLDIKTLMKCLKVFARGANPSIYFGEENTSYIRFFDKRVCGSESCVFITVCSYARKL